MVISRRKRVRATTKDTMATTIIGEPGIEVSLEVGEGNPVEGESRGQPVPTGDVGDSIPTIRNRYEWSTFMIMWRGSRTGRKDGRGRREMETSEDKESQTLTLEVA